MLRTALDDEAAVLGVAPASDTSDTSAPLAPVPEGAAPPATASAAPAAPAASSTTAPARRRTFMEFLLLYIHALCVEQMVRACPLATRTRPPTPHPFSPLFSVSPPAPAPP